jgi:hypothetical protein
MHPGRFRTRFPRWIEVAWVGASLYTAGCNTRDRVTVSDPNQAGSGPETIIDRPHDDTTVAAGPVFQVTGFTRDSDQVDTLYFETEGGVSSFAPFIGGDDSVRFGLPLTTSGQSGQTITVRVFGTDGLGNRGDTAIRHIAVQ